MPGVLPTSTFHSNRSHEAVSFLFSRALTISGVAVEVRYSRSPHFAVLWPSRVNVLHLCDRPPTGHESARILHYFTLVYNRTYKTPSDRMIELLPLHLHRALSLSS